MDDVPTCEWCGCGLVICQLWSLCPECRCLFWD